MIDWIVYYAGGSSFTSDDGPHHTAPRRGVQVVSVRSESIGKFIWHSSDYYCWMGEWVPRSEAGLFDYLSDEPGPEKCVLQGRGIPYAQFIRVYDSAVDDVRLPFKRGTDPREPGAPTR